MKEKLETLQDDLESLAEKCEMEHVLGAQRDQAGQKPEALRRVEVTYGRAMTDQEKDSLLIAILAEIGQSQYVTERYNTKAGSTLACSTTAAAKRRGEKQWHI